jgi:hypothetical protein
VLDDAETREYLTVPALPRLDLAQWSSR